MASHIVSRFTIKLTWREEEGDGDACWRCRDPRYLRQFRLVPVCLDTGKELRIKPAVVVCGSCGEWEQGEEAHGEEK